MGASKIVTALVAGAATALSTSASAQHRGAGGSRPPPPASEHVFYDISEDSHALKLLALSDSGKVGIYTMMDVIDVTGSPKLISTNTWRIDCAGERMAVVHAVKVSPGSPVAEVDVTPAPISTRASPASFRVAQLACAGAGELVERRTYRGELIDIVKRFWAQ